MIKGNNIMTIDGHPASVAYEAEIKAFRGKFLDVTGYCDFVSNSIEGLEKEGKISLSEYIETCQEEGIAPFREEDKLKSFTLRYPVWLEARLTAVTTSHSVSKNQFIVQLLERELQ
ncbi:toxin-antitoxin system HicB family antitoxin (plasmid) [Salmonella enterica subsp. enterica serovar Muenchen]|uniref:type II toxin-antitoxin system HicB family antitoxin n=1 Tax=Salmonella enterica TaxID=28901 RepID=UPI00129A149B|nr:type II toxin-antitoxin system HicB family antitoxin [Salmonella enterica]EAX8328940.1 type II toxin-antitoxin system HicB family antitoxin [Salmonella enterica]EIS6182925.1 type II toxin-antitoxin system HicB family antitoxin [Salmonella enterica]EJW7250423.1 type II toxin-antitoxin system HicB family antitoxin [Salmonella enterica]EKA6293968.1 type II toxin-antitoxin system HicB family antitoxin [Salmonella enterica]QGH05290.1 toxin-antitoxin system HicB family antitoxin [Salmonella enter